jgi:hypothetical protein
MSKDNYRLKTSFQNVINKNNESKIIDNKKYDFLEIKPDLKKGNGQLDITKNNKDNIDYILNINCGININSLYSHSKEDGRAESNTTPILDIASTKLSVDTSKISIRDDNKKPFSFNRYDLSKLKMEFNIPKNNYISFNYGNYFKEYKDKEIFTITYGEYLKGLEDFISNNEDFKKTFATEWKNQKDAYEEECKKIDGVESTTKEHGKLSLKRNLQNKIVYDILGKKLDEEFGDLKNTFSTLIFQDCGNIFLKALENKDERDFYISFFRMTNMSPPYKGQLSNDISEAIAFEKQFLNIEDDFIYNQIDKDIGRVIDCFNDDKKNIYKSLVADVTENKNESICLKKTSDLKDITKEQEILSLFIAQQHRSLFAELNTALVSEILDLPQRVENEKKIKHFYNLKIKPEKTIIDNNILSYKQCFIVKDLLNSNSDKVDNILDINVKFDKSKLGEKQNHDLKTFIGKDNISQALTFNFKSYENIYGINFNMGIIKKSKDGSITFGDYVSALNEMIKVINDQNITDPTQRKQVAKQYVGNLTSLYEDFYLQDLGVFKDCFGNKEEAENIFAILNDCNVLPNPNDNFISFVKDKNIDSAKKLEVQVKDDFNRAFSSKAILINNPDKKDNLLQDDNNKNLYYYSSNYKDNKGVEYFKDNSSMLFYDKPLVFSNYQLKVNENISQTKTQVTIKTSKVITDEYQLINSNNDDCKKGLITNENISYGNTLFWDKDVKNKILEYNINIDLQKIKIKDDIKNQFVNKFDLANAVDITITIDHKNAAIYGNQFSFGKCNVIENRNDDLYNYKLNYSEYSRNLQIVVDECKNIPNKLDRKILAKKYLGDVIDLYDNFCQYDFGLLNNITDEKEKNNVIKILEDIGAYCERKNNQNFLLQENIKSFEEDCNEQSIKDNGNRGILVKNISNIKTDNISNIKTDKLEVLKNSINQSNFAIFNDFQMSQNKSIYQSKFFKENPAKEYKISIKTEKNPQILTLNNNIPVCNIGYSDKNIYIDKKQRKIVDLYLSTINTGNIFNQNKYDQIIISYDDINNKFREIDKEISSIKPENKENYLKEELGTLWQLYKEPVKATFVSKASVTEISKKSFPSGLKSITANYSNDLEKEIGLYQKQYQPKQEEKPKEIVKEQPNKKPKWSLPKSANFTLNGGFLGFLAGVVVCIAAFIGLEIISSQYKEIFSLITNVLTTPGLFAVAFATPMVALTGVGIVSGSSVDIGKNIHDNIKKQPEYNIDSIGRLTPDAPKKKLENKGPGK